LSQVTAQLHFASRLQFVGHGWVLLEQYVIAGSPADDYILFKQDPAVTYELQPTGKMKLRRYLGQQVEVTGKESPSMSTSSDALARMGSPASVTLTITSIKTIEKECPAQQIPQQ